ncbi:MAG: hypothetical protein EBZ51_05885, partial [Synechococcaceae bacterium WB9_2_112]|nr:hypothetical protein [Synechococcaceae bacterium WB9_2_112]
WGHHFSFSITRKSSISARLRATVSVFFFSPAWLRDASATKSCCFSVLVGDGGAVAPIFPAIFPMPLATPPLASGCLPGIMRQRALDLGLAVETPISMEMLNRSDGALLLNSLGCRPIHGLSGGRGHGSATLTRIDPAQAEGFWRRLLDAGGASEGAQKQPWVEMR